MYRNMYRTKKFTFPLRFSSSTSSKCANKNPLSNRNVSTNSGEFSKKAF